MASSSLLLFFACPYFSTRYCNRAPDGQSLSPRKRGSPTASLVVPDRRDAAAGSFEHGGHDAGIAGAAAEMPAEHLDHLGLGRMRVAAKEIGERHQDAGGTEPALQRVIVLERLLQRIELAVPIGQ